MLQFKNKFAFFYLLTLKSAKVFCRFCASAFRLRVSFRFRMVKAFGWERIVLTLREPTGAQLSNIFKTFWPYLGCEPNHF